jgi:hypothetical protein
MEDGALSRLTRCDVACAWKPSAEDDTGGLWKNLYVLAKRRPPDQFERGGLACARAASQHDPARNMRFCTVAHGHETTSAHAERHAACHRQVPETRAIASAGLLRPANFHAER